jgi:hypothetical protein
MSSKGCYIEISNEGPKVRTLNGADVVQYEKMLTLLDYKPTVTNWTTWNGTLNKSDEIGITGKYKFIFLRVRNEKNNTTSNGVVSSIMNYNNYCSPANNSLIKTCCSSSAGANATDTLLDFQINQYTYFNLDQNTLYLDSNLVFDCTHGATATGVTGWAGCTAATTLNCGVTGATGVTGSVGITGGIGATCDVGSTAGATAVVGGIYQFAFIGVLTDNNLVIKTGDAECDYKCQLDYYAFTNPNNDYILFIFDNTAGKWVLVKLDQKINDIVENKIAFNCIELIEWGDYTNTYMYNSTNIALPGKVEIGGTIEYSGNKVLLDSGFPSTIKVNNLLVLEADRFDGKIISQLDGMQVSMMLAY